MNHSCGDGGRSQDADSREAGQEEPVGTQATARMATHRGADGGRSLGRGGAYDFRGPTDGSDAGGA